MAGAAETIADTTQSLLHVNVSNITKLTSTNYLTWSVQVHALLDGYDLASHIDGSTLPPSQTITTAEVSTPNPAYTKWKRQDRLIFSALLGTLTPSIQTVVTKSTSSKEMWDTVAATYAKPSRGHIQQLKHQLKQFNKGDKTIDEYVQGLQTRFDQLALLGKPVEHEDQIEFILEGLPDEYKSVVEQIEGRDLSPSITEVHEKLLTKEAKLMAQTPSPATPITANVATGPTRRFQPRNQPRHNQNWQPQNNYNRQQSRQDNNTNNGTTRGYQGKCQLCGVFGHSARRCPQFPQNQSGPSNAILPTPTRPWQPQAHVATASAHPSHAWLMDTGATHHMTSDLHNMSHQQPYTGNDAVLIGDGSGLSISHTGSISLPSSSRSLLLNHVLCVPHIRKNLISVYRLCNANKVSVEFFPAHFQVKDLNSGIPLLQGNTKDELYEWPVAPSTFQSFFASTTQKLSSIDWHHRLGHPSFAILKNIVSRFSLPCTPSSVTQPSLCSDCAINKSHKLPFAQTSIVSSRPLEYIFSDVWSSPILSIDKYKYYLVLVDHFTRYTWFYPLRLKSQVRETFIAFKELVENRFNTRIGTLYSDNGGEFVALRAFLTSSGISHFTSPPHTPEHNGISERKHRHIVKTGLTLLTHSAMPKSYWSYAFSTAVYLINRQSTPLLQMESPFQRLFGSNPNYSKLRVYGCLCFPWLRPYTTNKLEDRSTPCVFIGYSQTQSAYLCLQPATGRIYVSRHVRFDESVFPFAKVDTSPPMSPAAIQSSSSSAPVVHIPLTTVPPPTEPPPTPPPAPIPATATTPSSSSLPTVSTNSATDPTPESHSSSSDSSPSSHTNLGPLNSSPPQAHTDEVHHSMSSSPCTDTAHFLSQAHSESQSPSPSISSSPSFSSPSSADSSTPPPVPPPPVQPPPIPPLENAHQMTTRRKNLITKPNPKYNYSAALSRSVPAEPRTLAQALKDKRWSGAMSTEIDAFAVNRTFDLVQGALGRQGIHGQDYTETFSPVIKATTIRTVIDIVVSRSWPLLQLDVNNAFLQGTLHEEVYMDQPPGFVDADRRSYVCRLNKAVYGLKQAPRAWYTELSSFLISLGFVNSLADSSLFILKTGTHFIYLLVYVDDILVTGSNKDHIHRILQLLADRFSIKDPEDLNYFLGLEAKRTAAGLHLSQRK
ncbi:unnamed protein product [Microthlaspi erraticum]|uniref:Integrase catalytic domain-containing protein n=1 Tax=Microthlaspi erraticum TaxID=1685480 RepID=A0A6D2LBC6_9BRAS|nr:unnamed protein product [Microthlaspi erraticum]